MKKIIFIAAFVFLSFSFVTTTYAQTTPNVIKLNVDHGAKKLTGTINNPYISGASLGVFLYNTVNNQTEISLGTTPWQLGNFTIDLSNNTAFNALTLGDGDYFYGLSSGANGPSEVTFGKLKFKVTNAGTAATATKDNVSFVISNRVTSNTTGGNNSTGTGVTTTTTETSNTQTNTSGSSNSNSSGLSTGGQTNPSGNGNTPTNSAPAGSNPSGNGNTPFPPGSSSEDIEKLEDPLGEGTTLEGLILKLFEIIMYIGVPLVAFFLIWSGFMFVSAQGNPEKLETARNRLLYTIIGAIILLGAWTISQAIKGTVEDIKSGGQALVTFISHLG